MKLALLVVAFAHAAYCGNVGVRTSSLLSPAGVTYVDGSYHAGLAAGPVAYSASLGQSVYQTAAVAAAPAVAVSAQPAVAVSAQPAVAVAAQPAVAVGQVAYAAPATKYAAIPTVQHVPGVADVPVTRIDAQPGVIQKTVDVARPAVKTQRYEVRRPAIQKQFYDIEERVVVRPAGSAVVELEEPLSKTQKGPSVIRPTGDGVAVSSISGVSSISPAPPSPPLPSVEINYGRGDVGAPAPPSVEINYARGEVGAPAPPPVNLARSSIAASAPAVVSAAPSFTAAAPSFAAAAPSVGLARTSFAVSAPSVNFNLARSSFAAPAATATYSTAAFAPQSISVAAVPSHTVSVSAPVQTTVTGVSSISAGSSGISGVSFSTPAPQYQQQIVQSTPAPVYDDSVSIDSAEINLARSTAQARQGYQSAGPQAYAAPAATTVSVSAPAPAPVAVSAPAPTPTTVFRSAIPAGRYPGQAASASNSLIVNYPNALDLVPQAPQGPLFRSAPSYSDNSIQSEINHGNQQRLIQLLTARGGVTEVGFGRSGGASYPVEAGEVRARVLSATPAPAYSAPAGERVNTRRVVVSRPIETLQEVEVAEPVTKYERIRVDQPTVFKTARQGVVRVPTSVPVYGKTLAPIAEGPVAYAAGFH